MFNPNSVIQALYSDWGESYWGKTGAYDTVSTYIRMDYDGLKDYIIYLSFACLYKHAKLKSKFVSRTPQKIPFFAD